MTARIAVAEAARFPRLTILGLIGIGGTDTSDLGDLDNFSALLALRLVGIFSISVAPRSMSTRRMAFETKTRPYIG